jgi:5-methylcytosine-specific restriction endonuclease McrA
MSIRPGSKWRRKAFTDLVSRDGEVCAQCSIAGRTIWRQMGCWSGEQWGPDPWESHRYTKVHPTSNLEVDHRTPLSAGGSNDTANLWLLCIDCHRKKTSAERSGRLKRLFAEARAA